MDVEQTLKDCRAFAEQFVNSTDCDVAEFAACFQALDEWLTSRGFPPSDWARNA